MCHGREWPLPPLPHTETARGGAKAPGWGPHNPSSCASRLEGGGARRCAVRAPATLQPPAATPLTPPLSPTPAGAARPARAVRARAAPCCIIRAVRAARRAEGPRTAPSPPPPRQLALKANRRLAGYCAGGGEATGRFVPAPNGGLYPRHGAQAPVGGYHTTTHHRTTGTRER